MATVLLSGSEHTFFGIYVNGNWAPWPPRSVHSASPVLLTKTSPLATHRFCERVVT